MKMKNVPMEQEKSEVEYGWMLPEATEAYGPFKSVTAAMDDANRELGLEFGGSPYGTEVLVGPVVRPSPAYFASTVIDVNDLMEKMDEAISDGTGEFFPGDGEELFADKKGAQIALEIVVTAWAAQYIEYVGGFTLRRGTAKKMEVVSTDLEKRVQSKVKEKWT